MTAVKTRKKLIEVALPLDAINKASAREKSIRHGHPSTLHLWWARRPLAAARAVIFSQMVDDPSEYVDVLRSDPVKRRAAERELRKRLAEHQTKRELAGEGSVAEPAPTLDEVLAEGERDRLFRIIEELVLWENTTNEEVLDKARAEIWQSWRRTCADNADHPRAKELFDRNRLPGFHDPFAGGGALPLEAQRLGLEAYASDLNPVAVLINKAMIEIPPRFAGLPPVNPWARSDKALFECEWKGAHGLAEDVRYYGKWMRDEVEKRIGHLYPKVEVTTDMARERPDLKPYVGQKLMVIAWIWARTVKSPNPAFAQVDVPLASTFMLSTKTGKEAYVEPVIEDAGYRFTVKIGKPRNAERVRNGTKLSRGANFECLMSGTPIAGDYIRTEGKAGRMGARLMAIVAEGRRGRVYLSPISQHEEAGRLEAAEAVPEVTISGSTQYLGVKPYGIHRFDQLFTNRQLTALMTFSDIVHSACQQVKEDASRFFSETDDLASLELGGAGAAAYADAVALYLAFAVDKGANYWSSVCAWHVTRDGIVSTFGRQAIPMVFDYAEANPFSASTGNFLLGIEQAAKMVAALGVGTQGYAFQADSATQILSQKKIVSTDPPYFDNVPYADLSDFFYIWLRRSLGRSSSKLFATVVVPKAEELVAFAYRHRDKASAETFFLAGMTHSMHGVASQSHPLFPVTVYYAFRQAETDNEEGTASTGWDSFLAAVFEAGFGVSGTWPVRTEYTGNLKAKRNALALPFTHKLRRPVDARRCHSISSLKV